VNFVARWDGSTWSAFGSGVTGWVGALAEYQGLCTSGRLRGGGEGIFIHRTLGRRDRSVRTIALHAVWDGAVARIEWEIGRDSAPATFSIHRSQYGVREPLGEPMISESGQWRFAFTDPDAPAQGPSIGYWRKDRMDRYRGMARLSLPAGGTGGPDITIAWPNPSAGSVGYRYVLPETGPSI
jgi:hypothetical protein